MAKEKEPEPVFSAIPQDAEIILDLVGDSVDLFWERRRYGESWDDFEAPASFLSMDDRGTPMDRRARRVHKKLIFDLTAEILQEMYADEDADESAQAASSWTKARLTRSKYHRKPNPPTTSDELKPIVEEHILMYLGLTRPDDLTIDIPIKEDPNSTNGGRLKKWTSRKKKDQVRDLFESCCNVINFCSAFLVAFKCKKLNTSYIYMYIVLQC